MNAIFIAAPNEISESSIESQAAQASMVDQQLMQYNAVVQTSATRGAGSSPRSWFFPHTHRTGNSWILQDTRRSLPSLESQTYSCTCIQQRHAPGVPLEDKVTV